MTTEQLTIELVNLSEEYDPYSFIDAYDDMETAFNETLNAVINYPESIASEIDDMIEESDPDYFAEWIKKAKALQGELLKR